MDNIPRTGTVIIASNHRSNWDPPLLGSMIPREVHFFAKEELFRTGWLGRLISYLNAFPVRRGQFDRESLSKCLDILKHNGALLFFPEGTRAPGDGFLRAKLGIGWVICLSNAPVIPVYIHGSQQDRPCLLGRPRITVVFGKPLLATELMNPDLHGKELYQHVSDRVLESIRELSLSTPFGRVKSKGPVYERTVIEDERLR